MTADPAGTTKRTAAIAGISFLDIIPPVVGKRLARVHAFHQAAVDAGLALLHPGKHKIPPKVCWASA
jgi:hypothetical protein